MRRWGVLISGRGSNLGALIDARINGLDIRVVISSSPEALGLLRARRAGIPIQIAPFLPNTENSAGKLKPKLNWAELDLSLRRFGVTHVMLAGFMKIVPPSFIKAWSGRILNLHPSLLPAYPGLNSIQRAFDDHHDLGLTVHEVVAAVDAGKIVCQRRTLAAERANSLAQAEFCIHVDEQRIVSQAVSRW